MEFTGTGKVGYYTAVFPGGSFAILSSIVKLFIALFIVVAIAIGILWARSWLPGDVEAARIDCPQDAPPWTNDSPLKVMSYNVQYMASKNYVFFYDVDVNDETRVEAVENAGKTIASQPAKEHVFWTLDKVAEVIKKENPDIVLLQEINGQEDSRTHYTDQVVELLNRLPADLYPCQAEAPYWQAEFIFHPAVFGPVNMKLLTLSKYRITSALRHQLPRKPRNFLVTPFHFQRALLESRIATDEGRTVALINTHFDAWGAGTGIMDRQITKTKELLQSLDGAHIPWILGGDLNLLPPDNDRQRQRILAAGTGNYDEKPQLELLYERYRAVPPLRHLTSNDAQAWYTHFPNNPAVSGPDRTIDYLFYSDQWSLQDAYIRQDDTLDLSDHLPVVGVYSL